VPIEFLSISIDDLLPDYSSDSEMSRLNLASPEARSMRLAIGHIVALAIACDMNVTI
jgi:hypothetical protein